MQKRAQAAMEYLSTYGLAVLFIAIALAGLYFLGVFNTHSNGAPCSAVVGFSCTNPVLYSSGALSASIGNIAEPITITGVSCSTSSTNPGTWTSVSINVAAGQSLAIPDFQCPISSSNIGTQFTGYIWIEYNIHNGEQGLVEQVGSVNLAVSSFAGSAVPAGSGTLYYLPINITNNQNTSTCNNFTPTGTFQQLIVINPSQYSSYERPDLGNIRFYQASNELYSWCESGCNSSASSASFWLKLPECIAPHSTVPIQLTFETPLLEYDANYAGEAPQLSPSYAQYDNGQNVFNFYDGFSSLTDSNWGKYGSGTATISDKLTLTTGNGIDEGIATARAYAAPQIFESLLTGQQGSSNSTTSTTTLLTTIPTTTVSTNTSTISILSTVTTTVTPANSITASITSNALNAGQVELIAQWSGGAAPYHYGIVFYSGYSSACASDTTVIATLSANPNPVTPTMEQGISINIPITPTYYCVAVTDKSGDKGVSKTIILIPTSTTTVTTTIPANGISSAPYNPNIKAISTAISPLSFGGPTSISTSTVNTTTFFTTSLTPYYLSIKANPNSLTANYLYPQSGYYAPGSQVQIGADTCIGPGCETYHFVDWAGQGTISYTGTNANAIVTMDSNINETAYYESGQGTVTTTTTTSLTTTSTSSTSITTTTINASGPQNESAYYAYISNANSGTVSVINTEINQVIATVNVGQSPRGVAITPNGAFVYVANRNSDTVSVINTTTEQVIATIPVDGFPAGIAITPSGQYAYVTNWENLTTQQGTVSVIDTQTNKVIDIIPLGVFAEPTSVAITPSGQYVYVADFGDGSVSVISTATNQVTATISNLYDSLDGIAISGNGQYIYVTNQNDNFVYVINPQTNKVVTTINVGSSPIGVTFTPDSKYAYVADVGGNEVSVINTSTNTVVDTIAVGPGSILTAFTPYGSYAYVTNYNSDTVSIINTATMQVITPTIVVNSAPNGIAIGPIGEPTSTTTSLSTTSTISQNTTSITSTTSTSTTTVTTINTTTTIGIGGGGGGGSGGGNSGLPTLGESTTLYPSSQDAWFYNGYGLDFSNTVLYLMWVTNTQHGIVYDSHAPGTPVTDNILGVIWLVPGSQSVYFNDILSAKAGDLTISPITSSYHFYLGLDGANAIYTWQWARSRSYPPNGVMPTVNIGGITSSPTTSITTSSTTSTITPTTTVSTTTSTISILSTVTTTVQPSYVLTVSKKNYADGAVNGTLGELCGSTCAFYTRSVLFGQSLTLGAFPNQGYIASWTGCDSTTGPSTTDSACTVKISGSRTVNAIFVPTPTTTIVYSTIPVPV